VLAGPLPGTSAAYGAWRDAIEAHDVPVQVAAAGQRLDLGHGVSIEVLQPFETPLTGTVDDLNNNSVVLRLSYGRVSFLLTGDIAADAEAALLQSRGDLHATVLKLPHHGSDGSSTPAFLSAVRPAVAVVSAGDDNSFGHPSPTTRLRLAGTPLLRTDLNGSVRFETDGRRLWASFERGEVERLVGVVER
jgi:competence protein ComEC